MKTNSIVILILLIGLVLHNDAFCQKRNLIIQDNAGRIVTLSDSSGNLIIRLNYSSGCFIDKIIVNGIEVTGRGNVVYTGVHVGSQSFSSQKSTIPPVITIVNNSVKVNDIEFGNALFSVKEEWIFKVNKENIEWQIRRKYLDNSIIAENDFPCWHFNSIKTWDGAMLDNGGVAWNRLLDKPGDSYGSHTGSFTFWNSTSNNCLKITSSDDPNLVKVATFRHEKNGTLSVIQSVSSEARNTKYGLRRFLNTGENVFAPISVNKSDINIPYTLQSIAYD
ncbi:MAG: hypothetical protein ACRDE2_04630, partial [Chitinophagaceae bacterium]